MWWEWQLQGMIGHGTVRYMQINYHLLNVDAPCAEPNWLQQYLTTFYRLMLPLLYSVPSSLSTYGAVVTYCAAITSCSR